MKFILFALFSLLSTFSICAQETEKKPTELQDVVVTKTKKAVEKKADRTIFDFSSQSQLNSGSVLEGLKKLPGLIISDVAGMMYQGKQLDVYLDGRPLNISSNELNAYLEGMPANAIEKVEIVTQPGAEFPATSGGAIINIITSKSAKNYLSATYNTGFNFTNYDKLRSRFNNSVLINAKNKYFGWQINLGQNYRESNFFSKITKDENNNTNILSETNADRTNRNIFAKSALTFDIKNDRLLLNFDIDSGNNDAITAGSGFGFFSNDFSKTKTLRQDAVATYQKRFDNSDKKLDFRLNYTNNKNEFDLKSQISNLIGLKNASNQDYINFKIDYSQSIKLLDKGKIATGGLIDKLSFQAKNFGITNLNYTRQTTAGFIELQSSLNKFDFVLGTRAENYDIKGKTQTSNLIPFKQFRIFPNASIQYNFAKQIYLNFNYNKKINLPSTSSLNPNNTNYQNQNVFYAGNPQLEPTIYDNFEVEISAFDYANISYNVSAAKNQVINRILSNGNLVSNLSLNLAEIKIHNINFGIPVPYMLLTKGLAETLKMDFNPDKINFLYINASYQKHNIPELVTNGFWNFYLNSQILLPKEIKFVTNYSYNTIGGNYYYFKGTRPYNHSLSFSFSKKFLDNQLSLSLNLDDVFDLNRQGFLAVGTPISIEFKNDTRRFGFTMNYKIPTKNKLAKENPNLLNKDKKDEPGLLTN
jgi:Outer membrane protein beta-barrel family